MKFSKLILIGAGVGFMISGVAVAVFFTPRLLDKLMDLRPLPDTRSVLSPYNDPEFIANLYVSLDELRRRNSDFPVRAADVYSFAVLRGGREHAEISAGQQSFRFISVSGGGYPVDRPQDAPPLVYQPYGLKCEKPVEVQNVTLAAGCTMPVPVMALRIASNYNWRLFELAPAEIKANCRLDYEAEQYLAETMEGYNRYWAEQIPPNKH